MKKTVLFITLFVLISFQIKATAIIAIIYPDRIILSVDSRLTYTDNITGKKEYNTGCKLSTVNNFAFAFTGYRGYTGSISAAYRNFNTELYISSILKKNKTFNETFSELIENLEKELAEQMKIYKKLNFKDYIKNLKRNKANLMNIVIIGNDQGVPFAFAVNVILIEKGGTIAVKAQASVLKNKTTIIHAGVTDAVAKYVKSYPLLLQKEEPISLIDKLMELTIKDKPLDAGPPIDIVEVTGTTGLKWIRKKNGCPQIIVN